MTDPPEAPSELRSAPLWVSSRTLLAEYGKEFFSRWKKVAASYEEEDIHDLRVSSRRLREALVLFSPVLPEKKSKRLEKEVKEITRMLGEIRNTDEAFRFFSELAAGESARFEEELRELMAELRREREEAHMKLRGDFGDLDPEPLREEFAGLLDRQSLFQPGAADPFTSTTFFAGGAIMSRADTVCNLIPDATREEDGAAQHQLRISVKKLRYRLEILSHLLRYGYQELHDALKEYQDLLGKLHDVDVFIEMVRQRVGEGEGKVALLRVMAERRRKLYSEFMKFLAKVPLESIGERAKEAL